MTAPAMKEGITAHDAQGQQIIGTMPDFNELEFGDFETPPTEGYVSGATMEALTRALRDRYDVAYSEAGYANLDELYFGEDGTLPEKGYTDPQIYEQLAQILIAKAALVAE